MSELGYRADKRSDFFGGLTNILCESLPFIFPPQDNEFGSVGRIESTAKEFNDKFLAMDNKDKKVIANAMMDIFIKDILDESDFITMLDKIKNCCGAELFISQINYEISLPPTHGKAFLKKKLQCSLENLRSVYDSTGRSMIEITDDDIYAKALISHMVLYRSMCGYEAVIEDLKKRRVKVDDISSDLLQASIAIFRVCALACDKYTIEELQSTYAKMLSGEPLFRFHEENDEILS